MTTNLTTEIIAPSYGKVVRDEAARDRVGGRAVAGRGCGDVGDGVWGCGMNQLAYVLIAALPLAVIVGSILRRGK